MKFLFLTPALDFSGVERWFATLAPRLQCVRPHAVLVTAGTHIHPTVRREVEAICPVFEAHDVGGQRAVLSREMPHCDALLTWSHPGNLADLTTCLGAPVILVSHVSEELNSIVVRNTPSATHYAAVSKAAVKAFPESVRGRVAVIPNGSDMERSAPTPGARERLRAQWGVGDRTVVLFLGRIAKEKRPELLLSAMHELGDGYAAAYCGSGPLAKQIIDDSQRISNLVLVTDFLRQPRDVLAACDVVAVPSSYESFCLVTVEAWFARRPVASSPFEAARDFCNEHGEVMYLADNMHTPKTFAAAIRKAALDEGGVVERAWQTAWENYTATAMASRWDQYLLQVITEFHKERLEGCRMRQIPKRRQTVNA